MPASCPFDGESLWDWNRIRCRSLNLPCDCISKLFDPQKDDGNVLVQSLILQPKFLRIEYKVMTAGPPISDFRVLQLDAPEVLIISDSFERPTGCAAVKLMQTDGDWTEFGHIEIM